MSHYHHQRHGPSSSPIEPHVQPPSNHNNINLNRGQFPYPAPGVVGYSIPGDPNFGRFQPRQTGYPLPWGFHPQYGHPPPQHQHHSQQSPVANHAPTPPHQTRAHQDFRPPHSGPPKNFYPMPSPATRSPVHLESDTARAASIISNHGGSVASVSPDPDSKDHCNSIIQHPLFPLLRLLLEKLEEATFAAVTPPPEEINSELENLVRLIQQSSTSVATGRPDIDDLMLQAVTVLRLHLFELEKVNELCRDFCDRYTACLRKNLHTDQILRADCFDMDEPALNGHRADGRASSTARSTSVCNTAVPLPVTMAPSGHSVHYDMAAAARGALNPQQQMTMASSSLSIHPEDDLSLSHDAMSPGGSAGGSMFDDGEKYDPDQEDASSPAAGGKMSRRGILPKDAISVMKSWLFQHIMHPYPTEEEKRLLAGQTRLSLLQVNNWFINARRRILQPMLDASNPGGHRPKKGMQSRPVDPFWTGSSGTPGGSAPNSQKSSTQENRHNGSGMSNADEAESDDGDSDEYNNGVPYNETGKLKTDTGPN